MRDWKTIAVTGVFLAAGCVSKPVTAPRVVIPETVQSELRLAVAVADSFGDVTPIAVGLSNGSADSYLVAAERVFAVDARGNRIAPLSIEEAVRQAGGGTALLAGLRGAGGGALLTGVLGAATGAIVGAGTGGSGQGAAIGAGIGAATGAIGGFFESKNKTEAEIQQQIRSISLGQQTLEPGLPVSGFVFFPKGAYAGAKALAVNQDTNAIEEVTGVVTQEE